MCQPAPITGRTRKGYEVKRQIVGNDCQKANRVLGLQSQYFTAMPRPLAFSAKSSAKSVRQELSQ